MAGYGVEPTPERPTDDACERRLVAGSTRSHKPPEAAIENSNIITAAPSSNWCYRP
jgi:hypothetical protein